MKGRTRFIYLAALVLGFVTATTYPFSIYKNHATLIGHRAIFEKPGILVWHGQEISPETRRITIRLDAKPYSISQTGPARILTISRDHHHSNMTIGQEGSDLVIRLRRDDDSALGVPPFVVRGVFDSLAFQKLEVFLNENRLIVKVNGNSALAEMLAENPFQFWDATYRLALGNEHTWQRPWIGEISEVKLSVDASAVDLLSSKSIGKAGLIHQLRQKLVLVSPDVTDMIMNFALMLPFGALTASAFCRHGITWSLGLWFIAAAIVETTQALIPTRTPAISDVALNVIGAGTGAWLLVRFSGVGRQRRVK